MIIISDNNAITLVKKVLIRWSKIWSYDKENLKYFLNKKNFSEKFKLVEYKYCYALNYVHIFKIPIQKYL